MLREIQMMEACFVTFQREVSEFLKDSTGATYVIFWSNNLWK